MDSQNKIIYDLILDKFNENTQDVLFSGNYMFRFNDPQGLNFSVLSLGDSLEFNETEFVPLVDIQSIQVPFVEKNKRSDWEKEYYIAIKIEDSEDVAGNQVIEFDEDCDQYQAVLEVLGNFQDTLSFTSGDYKYTFKVKEPTKVAVMTYNGVYYQILALTFNLTSLQSGFFGNETKLYFGLATDSSFGQTDDYLLDFRTFEETTAKEVSKESYDSDDERSVTANYRTWLAKLTVNFNGNIPDLLLYDELSAQTDINTNYQIYVTNWALNTFTSENKDYTYNCIITSISGIKENNVVQEITFTLERS